MNERIQALAKQALKHPDNDNDGLTVFDNDELEKFAELIVKECADVAADHDALDIYEEIREHFGVEE
jgi:hypothetical protein